MSAAGAAKPRCLDIHAHHVGQPVIDRISQEGARHGVAVVQSGDGATRLEVGSTRVVSSEQFVGCSLSAPPDLA